jgi:16S rRNA (guanine527-N7)-methyltransferase
MEPARIRELLAPFVGSLLLRDDQIAQVSVYLGLLLAWNAKMNLTAVRDPEQVVGRHFGESLFAACEISTLLPSAACLTDVGSGAGFPGLPIKIALPDLRLTLIESQQKKAVFLREVVRTLRLADCEVRNQRAATVDRGADVVTIRAVESFNTVLPIAAKLVGEGGMLVLLIGARQVEVVMSGLAQFSWSEPKPIPLSDNRVILSGQPPPPSLGSK